MTKATMAGKTPAVATAKGRAVALRRETPHRRDAGRWTWRTYALAIAFALLPACQADTVDVSAFLGPQPGVVNVYKGSGEIHERLTYIEGVSAQGKTSAVVRQQMRRATDRPEQVRVLGQALQIELSARDDALIERNGGRILLKVPAKGTVHWKDSIDNVPGPAEAPRFQCSAMAPVSKSILGKNRLTILVTCELPAAGGSLPLQEVTLYAEGVGMVEQTETFISPPSSIGRQTPHHLQLIAIHAAK